MYEFSNHEKALLHLRAHMNLNPEMEFGAPFDITQDGVAMALGITRSHASTILSRMRKNGEVIEGMSRIDGAECRVKRKVYFLTSLGRNNLENRLNMLIASGVPESELEFDGKLDRFSDAMMQSMDADLRNAIGMLMMIRTPVHRRDLDPSLYRAITFDASGRVRFRKKTRERFMSMATDDEICAWHSMAADLHWDNGGPFSEILHHMVLARRFREAERVVRKHRFEIADQPDVETLESLMELCMYSIDGDVRDTATLMAVRLGDSNSARRILGHETNSPMYPEILLSEGRTDEALSAALENYDGTVDNALILGKCMVMAGRDEEALTFLGRARAGMMEAGCLFRLDEVLLYEAVANHDLGNPDKAANLARAGRAASQSRIVIDNLKECCPDAPIKERCSS